MKVRKHAEELPDDLDCFLLLKPPLWRCLQMGVQALALNKLHHQVNKATGVNRLVKFADIRVMKPTLDPDLSDGLLASLQIS